MNDLLTKFEGYAELGPVAAARLLGYSYSTYAQYRSGRRALPLYAARHVAAVLLLPKKAIDALIREHVYGES